MDVIDGTTTHEIRTSDSTYRARGMTVSELIEHLSRADPDKQVRVFWDGAPYGRVEAIYEDREVVIVGEVSIYGDGIKSRKVLYFDEEALDRPPDQVEPHWLVRGKFSKSELARIFDVPPDMLCD